jgi:hypothetical protein
MGPERSCPFSNLITRRRRASDHWGRGESNSHASRHMILSHACLPVPALPQAQRNVKELTETLTDSSLQSY